MSYNRVNLEISLGKLERNVNQIRSVSNCQMIAMIKANAYGHGVNEIHHFLHKSCSINEFGLASIDEAVKLRKSSGIYSSKLIVFSDVSLAGDNRFKDYLDYKVIPVISSREDLEYFLANNANTSIPLFIKVNTGMNRLGFDIESPESFVSLLNKYGVKRIDHLMTHFSSSNLEASQSSKVMFQYKKFQKFKSELQASKITLVDTSVSNSGAIEQGIGYEETHVRPGILLYGASVLDKPLRKNAAVKPQLVSSMRTSVIDSFEVRKGTEVGYGNIEVTSDGLIVVVGVGYGDGLPTRYSGARVLSEKYLGHVFGRINMDLTSILFPGDAKFQKGTEIELWGDNSISLTDLSDEIGLIPYEILCNVGQRINKEYVLN